jgi:PIN domain nuclease of toxin-antitoxin system
VRLLLDTHVFLWYVAADLRLPAGYRSAIQDQQNEVFLSVASVWECVIKHALGHLPLPAPPADYLPHQRRLHHIQSLPIDEDVLATLAMLPPLHRDPFDRVLVAQAVRHDLTLATVDGIVRGYPVKLL